MSISGAKFPVLKDLDKFVFADTTVDEGQLVERADLALEQRQIMQRVEHEIFPLIGAGMPGDDVSAAGNHHRVDITADQNFAMTVGGRHGIIGPAIAHQRQRTDPARLLLARVVG